VIILTVFLGLFFLTVGLDEIANPRLRRSVYARSLRASQNSTS